MPRDKRHWFVWPNPVKRPDGRYDYPGEKAGYYQRGWHLNKVFTNLDEEVASYRGLGCESTAAHSSLQAAIDASAYGAAVYVPPGRHVLSSRLTARDRPLVLRGERGLSEIIWDTGDPGRIGIELTAKSHNEQAHIADVLLKTTARAAGDAIRIDRSGEVVNGVIRDRISRRVILDNVEVSGATGPTRDGFARGIALVDVHNSRISNYHFEGMHGGSPVGVLCDAAIDVIGNGIPTELLIENPAGYFAGSFLKVRGKVEGVTLDNPALIAFERGVDWHTPDGRPSVTVNGGHMSTFLQAMRLVGADQIIAMGTRYYHRADATEDGEAIHMDGARFATISANIFTNTSQRAYRHVVGRNGTTGVIATGNVHQSGSRDYDFDRSCSDISHSGNLRGPQMGV